MFDPESFAQMDMHTPLHNLFLLAGRLSLRFDLLEKLFQRDSVIIAQVRQSRQRDAVAPALNAPDIQIGVKTDILLGQAPIPTD